MRKNWVFLIVVGLIISLMIMVIIKNNSYSSLNPSVMKIVMTKQNDWMKVKSKFQLVFLMNQYVKQIHDLERNFGKTGRQGYKIYTSTESQQLYEYYQSLASLLDYLNHGNADSAKNQWEGYQFSKDANTPYRQEQVIRVLAELNHNKVPKAFLKGLSIYILPYTIPGVSGLGGPGYILLSAQNIHETLIDNQLSVTLYHEIGHHVNFTFMPKDNHQGDALWAEFLKIRGGTWHGPGDVNTGVWGISSEETFAEDFRMLFGNNQPYFGDLALGDPRIDSRKTAREKIFLINLKNEKIKNGYRSPWIVEEGLFFWQNQNLVLFVGWSLLGLSILFIRKYRNPREGVFVFGQTKSMAGFEIHG